MIGMIVFLHPKPQVLLLFPTKNVPNERICYFMYRMGWIKFGVVSPRQHFLYTPSLAGSCCWNNCSQKCMWTHLLFDIKCCFQNQSQAVQSSTTYVRDDARYTDISNKRVHATTGSRDSTSPELEWIFDKLILIAISAQPNSFGILDVKEYVLFMKEVEESSKLQSRLLSNLEKVSA